MSDGAYVDDASIADAAALWRRIPPWHFVRDDNAGMLRPSSAAFENHPNGSPMSVVLGDEIIASGRSVREVVAGYADFAVATFTAGLARDCGQGVVREPLPEEPAHAVVFGNKPKRVARRIAKSAAWVISPGDQYQKV